MNWGGERNTDRQGGGEEEQEEEEGRKRRGKDGRIEARQREEDEK